MTTKEILNIIDHSSGNVVQFVADEYDSCKVLENFLDTSDTRYTKWFKSQRYTEKKQIFYVVDNYQVVFNFCTTCWDRHYFYLLDVDERVWVKGAINHFNFEHEVSSIMTGGCV